MSFQYSSEIVKTPTGEVNVAYYRQEAGRLRSEQLALIFNSVTKSVKKVFANQSDFYQTVTSVLFSNKLAK